MKVLYNRRGVSDYVLYDEAGIVERTAGVTAAQYPDYAALRGDTSDNLPGVPGIGEKTAAKLVSTYGNLEGIYEHLEAGEMADDAFVYVTVASLKDPTDAHLAPRGHSNVQIMTVVPREYALWNVPRGPAEGGKYHQDLEYRRRKHRVTERLVAAAERVLPGISAKVVWQESASPVTQERFTLSTGGTSYGIEYAVDQMGPMRPAAETEIAGLYLAGASTRSGHGIAAVMRSGVQAAAAVLGRDLMAEIGRGHVLGDPDLLAPLDSSFDAWRVCH